VIHHFAVGHGQTLDGNPGRHALPEDLSAFRVDCRKPLVRLSTQSIEHPGSQFRGRILKPFQLYVVCRQHDFGQPVATLLTPGNLRQEEAKEWQTLTLALSQLHRAKTKDTVSLDGQLVAFLLVFDSPEQNPGLTIDRIGVTRGMPAEPRSPMDLHEARLHESVDY